MDEPFRIRLATSTDLDAIAGIERQVFSDPWPRSAFGQLLGPASWVAEMDGALVGYLFARLAADEAEILNLAVRADCRRQGMGRRLLDAAVCALLDVGVHHLYLEVRESNTTGQSFYHALGFRGVGRRRGYYEKPREDALILARKIGPPNEPA